MMATRFKQDECNPLRLRLFLDDRLGGDETAELAQHLDRCERCRGTLEQLAGGSRICAELRQPTAQTHQPDDRDSPRIDDLISLDFLVPSSRPEVLGRLGRYEVREILGRGAFGVVLKAFDPELSRFVAIKVLAAHFAARRRGQGSVRPRGEGRRGRRSRKRGGDPLGRFMERIAVPGHALHRRPVAPGACQPQRAAGGQGGPPRRHAGGAGTGGGP